MYLSSLLKPPCSVDDLASYFTENTKPPEENFIRRPPSLLPTTGSCCYIHGCPACFQQGWPMLLPDPTSYLCTGPHPILSCPSTDSLQQFFCLFLSTSVFVLRWIVLTSNKSINILVFSPSKHKLLSILLPTSISMLHVFVPPYIKTL